jgi:hypothetical protein
MDMMTNTDSTKLKKNKVMEFNTGSIKFWPYFNYYR